MLWVGGITGEGCKHGNCSHDLAGRTVSEEWPVWCLWPQVEQGALLKGWYLVHLSKEIRGARFWWGGIEAEERKQDLALFLLSKMAGPLRGPCWLTASTLYEAHATSEQQGCSFSELSPGKLPYVMSTAADQKIEASLTTGLWSGNSGSVLSICLQSRSPGRNHGNSRLPLSFLLPFPCLLILPPLFSAKALHNLNQRVFGKIKMRTHSIQTTHEGVVTPDPVTLPTPPC